MKKILITGGFGKIAKHFVQKFHDKYEITVADIITDSKVFSKNVRVEKIDLTDLSTCEKLFLGIDSVIHLAGVANPESTFDQVLNANIIATKNVFEATIKAKCKRIIYASSAQTIEGYKEDIQVSNRMPIRPKNLYGVSKCFGEALGAYHAYRDEISVICLRIGAYEFQEDFTEMNARDLSAYIHPDDLNHLLDKCIQAEHIQFEILNAISNNLYKRLDISDTIEKVGYNPKVNSFDLFKLKKE